MKSKIIQARLDDINENLAPLIRNRDELIKELRKVKSIEWIQRNHVTINQVEASDGEGKPYFGILHEFGKWLYDNSDKKYCEWNGRIYRSKEIIAGNMPIADGLFDDLR